MADNAPSLDTPAEAFAPRSPLAFLGAALRGGLRGTALAFMAAWALLQVLASFAWARHLSSLAGPSALPRYWGEVLTARDAWELGVNGGFREHPVGPWTSVLCALGLVAVLWAGWRHQAESAGRPAALAPWAWSLLDTLLVGIVPVVVPGALLLAVLGYLGDIGSATFAWVDWIGGGLVRLAIGSTLMVQWWLFRLGRAGHGEQGWRLGSWRALGAHLLEGFLRLWRHPVHWSLLILIGVALRASLSFLALRAGWVWGGGSTGLVWAFLLVLTLAALVNAALIAWMMRLTALYQRHDETVRAEIRKLEAGTETAP